MAKINGLTGQQMRHIARQYQNGRTVEQIAEHWGISEATVKAVIAHRESLDKERGVIRGGEHHGL